MNLSLICIQHFKLKNQLGDFVDEHFSGIVASSRFVAQTDDASRLGVAP